MLFEIPPVQVTRIPPSPGGARRLEATSSQVSSHDPVAPDSSPLPPLCPSPAPRSSSLSLHSEVSYHLARAVSWSR